MDPGQLYALLRSIGQQSAHRNNDTGLWACKIPQVESRNLNDWDQKCDCSWASFRNFDAIHNPIIGLQAKKYSRTDDSTFKRYVEFGVLGSPVRIDSSFIENAFQTHP